MSSASEFWVGMGIAAKLMTMSSAERRAFEALELRIRTILPEEYQDSYEQVAPVSMGSAALKYGQDGKVAWDDVWDSFCDLAMAGGPPHKGRLLTAATRQQIEAEPERYQWVVEEICRGIELVTGLRAAASTILGWICIECTKATSGWLARAITMENVSARCDGTKLYLPAGPSYRVEKEIKNVVSAVAKTCHYWLDHVGAPQQRKVGDLFATVAAESPLIQPAVAGFDFDAESDQLLRAKIADRIRKATSLESWGPPCDGWLGIVCPSVKSAIWMMRAMAVSNVFARREDTVLLVPVNPVSDPEGDIVVKVASRVHRFARIRHVL